MSAGAERPRRGPTARSVAAEVLTRVYRDKAFAAASLDVALERVIQLDERERRLATELVYGSLRCDRFLAERLAGFTPHGIRSLDHETRAHLLVAAYQLLCLARIPPFAAVCEAVDIVRSRRGPALARFANAVLRKLADDVARNGQASLRDAILRSVDPWLLDRIGDVLHSHTQAVELVGGGPLPPYAGLRVRVSELREDWIGKLRCAVPTADVAPGKVSPLCIRVRGGGKLSSLPGHQEGRWVVQEEGAQVLALALGARPGERVLDACAGRGNKTSLLLEQVGSRGCVDAADLHVQKLRTLEASLRMLELPPAAVFAVDWSVGTGDVPDGYDRVLVDAPCSGMGTMRRRPDILQKDLRSALAELQRLQVAILCRAASRARPGGRVVYGVCSVLAEEAEDVLRLAQSQGAPLEPVDFDVPELSVLANSCATVRLLPHVHETDGYFLASLRRPG